jgi:hypothetical protein
MSAQGFIQRDKVAGYGSLAYNHILRVMYYISSSISCLDDQVGRTQRRRFPEPSSMEHSSVNIT